MQINANFDSGNIEVVDLQSAQNIQLKIRKDFNTDFSQWFHFCLSGAKHQACQLKLINANEVSFPEAWPGYQACASYDRQTWFRVPTHFDGKQLIISHTPEHDRVYYAYFAPYSYEQHQNLLCWAQQSAECQLQELGSTLDGRPVTLLVIGKPTASKRKIWLTARQHSGETMAEWFAEGFLQRLLDPNDPVAKVLLQSAVFYIVPNMNPDGSVRGNLRANAAGTDLNRSWREPTLEKSPEVFYVRAKMHEIGVDLFLDVHGDEELPYNFVAGAYANPSYTERQKKLETTFVEEFMQASPDFQKEYGYPIMAFSERTLTLASGYVADAFDCLSLTLEMPFKDNANLPDEKYGWSPLRAKKLAHASLDAIFATVPLLR